MSVHWTINRGSRPHTYVGQARRMVAAAAFALQHREHVADGGVHHFATRAY